MREHPAPSKSARLTPFLVSRILAGCVGWPTPAFIFGKTPMPYKVAVETLGCRLNQAESAVFVRQFLSRGYEFVPESTDADLCIINTCNLTSQATAKCRRLIRSIIRRNPDACIAAVGCYAQATVDELQGIAGLDYIVGTSEKMRLPDIIPSPVKMPEPVVVRSRASRHGFTIDGAGYYPLHTRANLKVQEGCNFVCAFCIIPKSRGPARSRDLDDIVREARVLVGEGHREFVITGVNVGTYNDNDRTLGDVIDALEEIDGLDRIRLSSIEPTTIEDRIVRRMEVGTKLCPYLHVPLQSGDDGVLVRMRRRYTARAYRSFLEDVIERVPAVGLGTDVIVGMPGEDDAAFENTVRLIDEFPFTNIHVFSFSAREGTSAYNMSDAVPPHVIAERSRILHRLADRKRRAFYENQIGGMHRVLFEQKDAAGRWIGFSDNYVKVAVEGEGLANHIGRVAIHGISVDERHPIVALGDLVGVDADARTLVAHEPVLEAAGGDE